MATHFPSSHTKLLYNTRVHAQMCFSNNVVFHDHFCISSKIQRFSQLPSSLVRARCTSVPTSCYLDNRWRQSNKSSSSILCAMTSIQRKLWRWQPNWTPLVSQPSKTLSATSVAITKAPRYTSFGTALQNGRPKEAISQNFATCCLRSRTTNQKPGTERT